MFDGQGVTLENSAVPDTWQGAVPAGGTGEPGPEQSPESSEQEGLDQAGQKAASGAAGDGKGKTEANQGQAGQGQFAGKTAEDLISIITEQNRYISRQGNAIGKVNALEQQLAELQNRLAEQGQFIAQQQQPQYRQPQPQMPEFDITNPAPYINHLAEQMVEQRLAERLGARDRFLQDYQARENQRIAQEAQINYIEGRDAALNQNPDLFGGIEADVEQAVRNSVKQGIITPAMLRSPRTWIRAAQVLRLERDEVDKIATRRPVKPVEVEKPGRPSTFSEDDIFLSDADREEMRRFGISEQEAKENIRIAMQARAQGLQK
ncbi:MAG: hypothetical protein M0R06_02545 [Sphaerochaeta sp.]|jgi:hypothetical protein|nr:hypothetical protein [Sphaerochaeta sp.]